MTTSAVREYVLGTGGDELERLGLQHRLWSDATHELWRTAAIAPGQRVLDVGCGPGYAAFDLAQLVQRSGRVFGVDESPNFVAFLNEQAAARHLPQLAAAVGDVQALGATLAHEAPFDLAYARWVLCFVPRPADVIAGIARALRPGGRLVVQDYFNYESMTLSTKSAAYKKAVAATARSWRAHGGDPDIAGRLPRLFAEHGLELTHLAQRQRTARSGESMWNWVASWWRIYVPKLVAMGELTAADQAAFFRDFDGLDPRTDFALLPTVFELVAVKR
jgi:ubiquinone/menaquinone biosynthesis C-methylase UbiE